MSRRDSISAVQVILLILQGLVAVAASAEQPEATAWATSSTEALGTGISLAPMGGPGGPAFWSSQVIDTQQSTIIGAQVVVQRLVALTGNSIPAAVMPAAGGNPANTGAAKAGQFQSAVSSLASAYGTPAAANPAAQPGADFVAANVVSKLKNLGFELQPIAVEKAIADAHQRSVGSEELQDTSLLSDPVDPLTGEFTYRRRDLYLEGVGISLDLTRTYRSRSSIKGLLGWGWHYDFEETIELDSGSCTGAQIIWTRPDGIVRFPISAPTSWPMGIPPLNQPFASEPASPFELVAIPPGGAAAFAWEIRERNGLKHRFGGPKGHLASLIDGHGNHIDFKWAGEGTLQEIVDSVGRVIRFTYSNGLIQTIEVVGVPGIAEFAHGQSGDLTSATSFAGVQESYEYFQVPGAEVSLAPMDAEVLCRAACSDFTFSASPPSPTCASKLGAAAESSCLAWFGGCSGGCEASCAAGCATSAAIPVCRTECASPCAAGCDSYASDATNSKCLDNVQEYCGKACEQDAAALCSLMPTAFDGNPEEWPTLVKWWGQQVFGMLATVGAGVGDAGACAGGAIAGVFSCIGSGWWSCVGNEADKACNWKWNKQQHDEWIQLKCRNCLLDGDFCTPQGAPQTCQEGRTCEDDCVDYLNGSIIQLYPPCVSPPDANVPRPGICSKGQLKAACLDTCDYKCSLTCTNACEVGCTSGCKESCSTGLLGAAAYCKNAAHLEELDAKAQCEETCVGSLVSRDPATGQPRYGSPAALGHNLLAIRNGAGVQWLTNTYGTDPLSPSFDRVITQNLGSESESGLDGVGHAVSFQYFETDGDIDHYPTDLQQFGHESQLCSSPCDNGHDPNCVPAYFQPIVNPAKAYRRATVITDAEGAKWAYFGDEYYRVRRRVALASGASAETDYDNSGRVAGWMSMSGQRTCLQYPTANSWLPIRVTSLPGAPALSATQHMVVQYSWAPSGELLTMTRPNSADLAVWQAVNDKGLVVERRTYSSPTNYLVEEFRYDARGRAVRYDNPSGLAVHWEYLSGSGLWSKRTEIAGADVRETSRGYDAMGKIIDQDGDNTPHFSLAWDGDGRLIHSEARLDVGAPAAVQDVAYDPATGYPAQVLKAGRTESFDYTSLGRLRRHKTVADAVTTTSCFRYDGRQQLVEIAKPEGNRVRIVRDAFSRPTRVVKGGWSASPEVAANAGQNWLAGCEQFQGSAVEHDVWSGTRDVAGRVVAANDGGVVDQTYTYDGFGRLVKSAVLPCGASGCSPGGNHELRMTWNLDGTPESVAVIDNSAGVAASTTAPGSLPDLADPAMLSLEVLSHDFLGRPTAVSRKRYLDRDGVRHWLGQDATTTWSWNDAARTATITDPDNYVTTVVRNEFGDIAIVDGPGDLDVSVQYLDRGQRVRTTYNAPTAAGQIAVESVYRRDGQIKSSTVVGGAEILAVQSDPDGNPTDLHSRDGHTRIRYDGRERAVDVRRVSGAASEIIARYDYDRNGRRVTTTDGLNHKFVDSWDFLDRYTGTRYDDGTETSLSYLGGWSKPSQHRDRAGSLTQFAFDATGEVGTTIANGQFATEPGMVGTLIERGPLGIRRVNSYVLGHPEKTVELSFLNDSLGMTQEETNSMFPGSNGLEGISYAYTPGSRLRSQTVKGVEIATNPDFLGRPTSVYSGSSPLALYTYAGFGLPKAIQRESGVVDHMEFDSNGQLKQSTILNGLGQELDSANISRDALGQTRRIDRAVAGQVTGSSVFAYDEYRRAAAERHGVAGLAAGLLPDAGEIAGLAGQPAASWTTDPANNWSRVSTDDQQSVFPLVGHDNRYTSFDSTVSSDANGNTIALDDMTLGYDGLGRLARAERVVAGTGTVSSALVYDGFGRLAAVDRTAPGGDVTRTLFQYGAGEVFRAKVGAGHPVIYAPGLPGKPTAALGASVHQLHYDATGRLTAMTSPTGALEERYLHSLYGVPKIFDGVGQQQGESLLGVSMFGGHQPWLTDYGIQRLGLRSYVPRMGRFLEPDPMGLWDGPNAYAFVGNQPQLFHDPLGLGKAWYEEVGVFAVGMAWGMAKGLSPVGAVLDGIDHSGRDHFRVDAPWSFMYGEQLGIAVGGAIEMSQGILEVAAGFAGGAASVAAAGPGVTLPVAIAGATASTAAVASGGAHILNAGYKIGGASLAMAALGRGGGGTGAGRSATVYRSVDAAGEVQYVGITNNLARRAAEHLRGSGIQIEKLMGGLSRTDARAVEQALIEVHGLQKSGGTLLNRINSIASTNPAYSQQLQRGYELLQSIGYK